MQKLVMAKAIMDKTEGIKRTDSSRSSMMENTSFDIPNAKYNIPQEYLSENPKANYLSEVPNTKPVGVPTTDAIKKSKLPEEIKRLMIEHPIAQPQQQTTTISNELVEKASRLMKSESHNYVPESAKPKQQQQQKVNNSDLDYNQIKKMIEEAVNKSLKENGLLIESTEKSNETFSFRVGKHIFEGKVTKIKKIQ